MRVARAERRLRQWQRAQRRQEHANGHLCLLLPGHRRLLIRLAQRDIARNGFLNFVEVEGVHALEDAL